MDSPAQPLGPQNGARPMPQRNSLSEYRSRLSSDGYPPPPGIGISGTPPGNMPARNGFGHISRSPPSAPAPSNKNTKHVPCKFFRQGACTAGDACPYSHADTPLEPCKFFLNGNCKYGQRCALPHILHGRILNPQCLNPTSSSRQRPGPGMHSQSAFPPLQAGPPSTFYGGPAPEASGMPIPAQSDMVRDFGSPAMEARLGLSPTLKGFSALDAPLPASYNSQDIPNIAKFGPNASSVPAKSGWSPLTSSSPTTSTTSNQAFRNLDTLAATDPRTIGTSPPNSIAYVEPRRILFTDRRSLASDTVSASLPVHPHPEPDALGGFKPARALPGRAADDDDDGKGEEFLPSSLSELLSDREKLRRFSRSEEDRPTGGRTSMSSFGSPGSPSHASPSRFGAFFASQAKKEKPDQASHATSSPFGHVGSPLRSSSTLHTAKPRDFSGGSAVGSISPPRSADHSQYVSSLSEQLKELRFGSAGKVEGSDVATRPPAPAKRDSRTAGTGTIGREKIDEEPYLFSMEDMEVEGGDEGVAGRGKPVESAPAARRFADVAAMGAGQGQGSS